jgi:Metal-dependent hydrolases of the beta-lactamase superfamily II
MKISVLAENTAVSPELSCEHGLSLFIETEQRSILFDMGASDIFCRNAAIMGIDLSGAEFAVLSHGHFDHGGGLAALFACNEAAPVYVSAHAFGDYLVKKDGDEPVYIGLDSAFAASGRIRYVNERLDLGEGCMLFSAVGDDHPRPSGNSCLFMRIGQEELPDDFRHEQNLLLTANGKSVLFAGCAHSGIVNILAHCCCLSGAYPDVVIGGFHLIDRGNDAEALAELDALAQQLLQTGAMFYTCHCTGLPAYEYLRSIMGERTGYLATGAQLTL